MLLLLFATQPSQGFVDAIGTASGTSTAAGVGATFADSVGTASGTSTASGSTNRLADAVGSAAGTSTASGSTTELVDAVGTAVGTSSSTGQGASFADSVGTSHGTSEVFAITDSIGPPGSSGGRGKKKKHGLEAVVRPKARAIIVPPIERKPLEIPTRDELEELSGRRTRKQHGALPPPDHVSHIEAGVMAAMQRALDDHEIGVALHMIDRRSAADEAEIAELMHFL